VFHGWQRPQQAFAITHQTSRITTTSTPDPFPTSVSGGQRPAFSNSRFRQEIFAKRNLFDRLPPEPFERLLAMGSFMEKAALSMTTEEPPYADPSQNEADATMTQPRCPSALPLSKTGLSTHVWARCPEPVLDVVSTAQKEAW
jgi:hypothetical protein